MNVAIKLITVSAILLGAVMVCAIVMNVILLSVRLSCLNLNLIVKSVKKSSRQVLFKFITEDFCTTHEHYNYLQFTKLIKTECI